MKEPIPGPDNSIKKYKKLFKSTTKPSDDSENTDDSLDENKEISKDQNNSEDTEGGLKGKVNSMATKAAEQAISKGLASYGVPIVIADKIGQFGGKHVVKYGKKLLFLPFIFILIVILLLSSLYSVVSSGGPAIKPSQAAKEIPKPYLEAYFAASEASGIPWTIFAGIGKVQSNHGRVSPYDDIIRSDAGLMAAKSEKVTCVPSRGGCITPPSRTEGSVYSCAGGRCGVTPAIGVKDEEGKGPYLIQTTTLKTSDNPQDIKKAVMFVAEILIKAADEQRKGLPDTYGYDEKTANAYWLGVVSSLDTLLSNPESSTTDCSTLADGESVTTKIYVIWRCEIVRAKLHLLTDVKVNDKNIPIYSEVQSSLIAKTLISEAYAVSYNYSKWDNSGCSKTQVRSGIFPISKAQYKKANIDRCDDRQNIALAARLVISGESKLVENRSNIPTKYQPLIIGWEAIYGSLGSPATVDAFLTNGPNSKFNPSNTCLNTVDSWLKGITSKDNPVLDIDSYTPAADSKIENYLNSLKNPINDFNCQNNGKAPSKQAFNDTLLTESNIIFSELSDSTIVEVSGQIKRIGVLQNYFTTQQQVSAEVIFGEDSSVARLSSTGVKVNYPAPLELTTGYGSDFAKKVINFALSYGGLFEGDERSGTNGEPIGIAYLRDMTLQGQIDNSRWSSDFPKAKFSANCGYSGNDRYEARQLVVTMWEDLCQAAKLVNVDLQISSGYRDNTKQTNLRAGDSTGMTVASPAKRISGNWWSGGSPHEKGIAIDLPLKKDSRVSYTSYELLQLHFLHDVVGCYNTTTHEYFSFDTAMDYVEYGNGNTKQCKSEEVPIKRVNTFGFAVYCSKDDPETGNQIESPANPASVLCTEGTKNGTDSKGTWVREQWHIQPGQPVVASSPLKDNQGILDAIHSNYPISEWDNAIAVAKKVSGFSQEFILASRVEPFDPMIGLYAIPANAYLKKQYLKVNNLTSTDIDAKNLTEWTQKLENNVKIAHQIWLDCGWGFWKDVEINGVKPGCDKAGADSRKKSDVLIDGSKLPSQLRFALMQVGKRYQSGNNNNLAFDNISLIATAFDDQSFSGLSGLELYRLDKLTKLPLGSEQKGDLIFLKNKNDEELQVGIVNDPSVGDFVMAIPGTGVTILSNYKKEGKYYAQLKGFARK